MNIDYETLGLLIDDLDNLAHGLQLKMPADFHVEQLKEILPEKVKELKKVYQDITGENPWE